MATNSTVYGYPMREMPTPEEIESAMQRGKRERSQMYWSILRAVGGLIRRVVGALAQAPRAVGETRASAA